MPTVLLNVARFRLEIAGLFYGILVLGALGWNHFSTASVGELLFLDESPLRSDSDVVRVIIAGAAGVAFGLGIARLSRFLVYRFQWARGLHIEFRGLLGPLRNVDVLVFAALSAVAEELFFRGAVQSSLGIVGSSVVFGFLHIGPGRKFLPWPFQAAAMGFAFGGLFWLTGSIAAPIMAHFVINYQNLHFINRYDPSLQLPRTLQMEQ